MRNRWALLAVLVPLVGLVVLVGRAELAVRSGPPWRVAIAGYDPRDMLHGRFLRYRFDFDWQGEHTCGPEPVPVREPVAGCCLCLTRTTETGVDPTVRQVDCESARSCDGWLRAESVRPPLRHFVPEDRAGDLERALLDGRASMEFVCTPSGQVAIRELYLDGRPWRDAID